MTNDISEQILELCREGCLLCAWRNFRNQGYTRAPPFMFYPYGPIEDQLSLHHFLSSAQMKQATRSFQHTSRCEDHWMPDRNAMKSIENAIVIPSSMESLFRIANGASPLCTIDRGMFSCEWKDDTCVWCDYTIERKEESEEE